jgi:hypothetical protein
MDPYLEAPQRWLDFHNDLAAEMRAALNRVIQPRYFAQLSPYVTYEVLDRVEVRTTDAEQLVTLIEILSPANKRPGHDAYLEYQRKRRELLRSPVHLMEIDLLRGGSRPPLEEPVPPASYYVVLSRAPRRPRVEVWPIQLRDRLPVLPVPLLEPDADAPLDLGAAVASVYERGAYETRLRYDEPSPPPPLSEEERARVDALLQEAGTLRSKAQG